MESLKAPGINAHTHTHTLKGTELHFQSPTAERRHVQCVEDGRDRNHVAQHRKSKVYARINQLGSGGAKTHTLNQAFSCQDMPHLGRLMYKDTGQRCSPSLSLQVCYPHPVSCSICFSVRVCGFVSQTLSLTLRHCLRLYLCQLQTQANMKQGATPSLALTCINSSSKCLCQVSKPESSIQT